MIPGDIQARIRSIELMTKKLISGPLLGDWQSSVRGSGFEFLQLRDYMQGDDIRFIDWKASARTDKMLVRQYLEDRNRTIYIIVDVSASADYSTGVVLKSDLMRQLAAVLAFVGQHKKDSVGLVLFSDDIEIVMPPRQSRDHYFSLIKTVLTYKPKQRTTNLAAPLEYLARRVNKKSMVCFISDFTSDIDQRMLSLVSRKHDMLAFRCLDEREQQFPDCGTLIFQDIETDELREIEGTVNVQALLAEWHRRQKEIMSLSKVDLLDLIAGKPYTGQLVQFLRQRIFG